MYSAVQFILASVYDVGTWYLCYSLPSELLCLGENNKIYFEIEKYCFLPVVFQLGVMSRTYFVYLYNMVLFDDVFSEYMHLNPLDTVEMKQPI